MHEQDTEVSEAESQAIREAESQVVREAIVCILGTLTGLALLFGLGYLFLVSYFWVF